MSNDKTDADAYAELAAMAPDVGARCRERYDELRARLNVRDAFIQTLQEELAEQRRRLDGLLGRN